MTEMQADTLINLVENIKWILIIISLVFLLRSRR